MTFTPIEAVVIVLAMVVVAISITMRTRSPEPKRRKFRIVPEYFRSLQSGGHGRETRPMLVEPWSGRPTHQLPEDVRQQFIVTWRAVQVQFAQNPRNAIARADDLLGAVMTACGYPVHDFAEQDSDLSAHHADLVLHYRTAHLIAVKQARGIAGIAELRTAMTNYRVLFDDLVNEPVRYASQSAMPGGGL